jgi:hypothetical protein
MAELYCGIKEYRALPNHKRPRSFDELMDLIKRPGGFWRVQQINALTGALEVEQWLQNNWTDNGVSVMMKAAIGASTPSFTPASIMVISATLGATTLTSSIASGGTVTSITVAAPTGATIPSGTKLVIDPAGQAFKVTLTAAISGAGSVAVSSVTGPASTIASGASVRYDYTAVPTADPSSIASPVSYTSSMPAGQFTYTGTTGYGNRTYAITNNSAYLFSTTGSPAATAGSYTEAWMSNTNPISAATQTVLRVAFDNILVINSTTNGRIDITEKL